MYTCMCSPSARENIIYYFSIILVGYLQVKIHNIKNNFNIFSHSYKVVQSITHLNCFVNCLTEMKPLFPCIKINKPQDLQPLQGKRL